MALDYPELSDPSTRREVQFQSPSSGNEPLLHPQAQELIDSLMKYGLCLSLSLSLSPFTDQP
jgi:hypothetical protein